MDTEDQTHIIKRYRRFFVIVFKYLFLVLALCACVLLFQKIFLGTPSLATDDDTSSLEKTKLIATFQKFLKQTIQGNDIEVFILQWPLLTKDNLIISQNNLISYKWFIVPRILSIPSVLSLKDASYFQDGTYATGELERFITNLILTSQDDSPLPTKSAQIILKNTIADTFNLGCLFETKFYQQTCNHYLKQFLSPFFVYQLDTDYTGLQNVFSSIQQNEFYRNEFCATMKKYVLYSNDTNKKLVSIFDACGVEYEDFFRKMLFFVDIQQQLQNHLISNDVYKDQTLNIYKLLSYQQVLYQDFQDLQIRNSQYVAYLGYVQELVKRKAVPSFYLDEIYWYNTYYLKRTLLTTRYDNRLGDLKETDITTIVKTIDTINMGSSLQWYSGLVLLVSNPRILANTISGQNNSVETLQQTITKEIMTISYLTIVQSSIVDDTIYIKWYFLVGNQKIPSTLRLIYQENSFFVQNVDLPNYSELTSILQWLVSSRSTSIGELFSAVTKNLPLYQNNSVDTTGLTNMCASVRGLETSLDMKVSICTVDVLVLSKMMGTSSVTYTFFLQNFSPTTIIVSDVWLQSAIEDTIANLKKGTTLTTLLSTILDPSSITSPTQHEGSANTIAALVDMQTFLGITPNDIAEKDNKILIDFSLNKINFVAGYIVKDHLLSPRYFKDIPTTDGLPLLIQDFSLALNDKNLDIISLFIKDPLSYIKAIDLTAWKNYTERQ